MPDVHTGTNVMADRALRLTVGASENLDSHTQCLIKVQSRDQPLAIFISVAGTVANEKQSCSECPIGIMCILEARTCEQTSTSTTLCCKQQSDSLQPGFVPTVDRINWRWGGGSTQNDCAQKYLMSLVFAPLVALWFALPQKVD